jgi:hypothetical protein
MGMPQLVVNAVLLEGRSKSEVTREYGVSRRWVMTLVQRYLAEATAAYDYAPEDRCTAPTAPANTSKTRSSGYESNLNATGMKPARRRWPWRREPGRIRAPHVRPRPGWRPSSRPCGRVRGTPSSSFRLLCPGRCCASDHDPHDLIGSFKNSVYPQIADSLLQALFAQLAAYFIVGMTNSAPWLPAGQRCVTVLTLV